MVFPLSELYYITNHTEYNCVQWSKSDGTCDTAHNHEAEAVWIQEKQNLAAKCNKSADKCDISFSEFLDQR